MFESLPGRESIEMEKKILSKFLVKRAKPLIDKINADPEHLERVLTGRESAELATIVALKEMVERGELSISERDGGFYFECNKGVHLKGN